MRNIFLIFLLFVLISCDSNSSKTVSWYEVPQTVTCPNCAGYGSIQTYYGIMQCPTCAGLGSVSISTTSGPNVSFGSSTTMLVQTNAECHYGSCECSGYKGIRHDNDTFEGACQHSDGFGHTCGHGPDKHGLKKW